MCSVKSPTVTTPAEKDPIVVRNRYLDGVGPEARAMRVGRNSLRIQRGTTVNSSPPVGVVTPRPQQPEYTPIAASGGGVPSLPNNRGSRLQLTRA